MYKAGFSLATLTLPHVDGWPRTVKVLSCLMLLSVKIPLFMFTGYLKGLRVNVLRIIQVIKAIYVHLSDAKKHKCVKCHGAIASATAVAFPNRRRKWKPYLIISEGNVTSRTTFSPVACKIFAGSLDTNIYITLPVMVHLLSLTIGRSSVIPYECRSHVTEERPLRQSSGIWNGGKVCENGDCVPRQCTVTETCRSACGVSESGLCVCA